MSDHLTPNDRWIIRCLQNTINGIYSGKIDGVGLCSVDYKGVPSFVYYNDSDDPVLRPAISRLMGLYEMNYRKGSDINAPMNNRSYGTH